MELFVLALLRIPHHLLFLSSIYQISEDINLNIQEMGNRCGSVDS